jgi:hypothetical protein
VGMAHHNDGGRGRPPYDKMNPAPKTGNRKPTTGF